MSIHAEPRQPGAKLAPVAAMAVDTFNGVQGSPESASRDLEAQVETAFVRYRREYLALREAIQDQSDFDIDIAYADYGAALRHYLKLVSVRLYLPIQWRLRRAVPGLPDQSAYLQLARNNMKRSAAMFRTYRDPASRQVWGLHRDLERLDNTLQAQYRRERTVLLGGQGTAKASVALVA